MRYWSILILLGLSAGCDSVGLPDHEQMDSSLLAVQNDGVCSFEPSDLAWLERSIEAWRTTIDRVPGISLPNQMSATIYDADCSLNLTDAMTLPAGQPIQAVAAAHDGELILPDGSTKFDAPIGPMSATFPMDDGSPVFVMSLPTLWEAGGVDSEELGREALMTAVVLHEGAHVFQFESYGREISAALDGVLGAEEFDDDTLQDIFESDKLFAESIAAERQLLLEASRAEDDETARSKIQSALEMISLRDEQYLVGKRTYMRRASDVFWTLEGSGQWIGAQWLASKDGGGFDTNVVEAAFGTRARWWSQSHGFAMASALSRIDPNWPSVAFGGGGTTLRELLETALEKSK